VYGWCVLTSYDAAWPAAAEHRLAELRRVLVPLDPESVFDHIGSTSVPGLLAKPLVDLQVRMSRLPDPAELDHPLLEIGFRPHAGARDDSPGVHRDSPRGSEQVPEHVWEKRLFTASDPDTVLHVRRLDSPWGRHTVMFRDWLRAHPAEVDRYAEIKQSLAREHADDPDFDNYTRAKTVYLDLVQEQFETWAEG